jgi:hypothetical protein
VKLSADFDNISSGQHFAYTQIQEGNLSGKQEDFLHASGTDVRMCRSRVNFANWKVCELRGLFNYVNNEKGPVNYTGP